MLAEILHFRIAYKREYLVRLDEIRTPPNAYELRGLRNHHLLALHVASGARRLWQRICREAGRRLPRHYLSIGLLGFRRLPEADEASELPWVSGLAQWALERKPSDSEFKVEWLALKPLISACATALASTHCQALVGNNIQRCRNRAPWMVAR